MPARLRVALIFGVITLVSGALPSGPLRGAQLPCAAARRAPEALRLPAVVPPGEPVAIERHMLDYLLTYRYRDLGWCLDRSLRDTGPFIDHSMYGTHPVVRIYYSPEMIAWLQSGRKGAPRDGAVMIKEQYGTSRPSVAFAGKPDAAPSPTDWTIMIRRGSASHDGWFWAEIFKEMFEPGRQPSNRAHVRYPDAGFGLYCLRCHASAQTASTFASLENVRGFPGEPLQYRVDDSWRWSTPVPSIERYIAAAPTAAPPLSVQTFPAETLDSYLPPAHGSRPFLTSSQCMACHAAAAGLPFGPTMWLTPSPHSALAHRPGVDVSEYGEWRWSPMALAGRDPVFYAQAASELGYVERLPDARLRARLEAPVTATCASCHGVMGKRTYTIDHPGKPFSLAFVFENNPAHEGFTYGGLARDGVSCMVCHRIAQPHPAPGYDVLADFFEHNINGGFELTPADRLNGPFKDDVIATHAMKEALGIKPVYSRYITSSALCGSCHTIDLPVVDNPNVRVASPGTGSAIHDIGPEHNVEQATYPEWLNSRYQTERSPGRDARSCQDCHMPAGVVDPERGIALSHLVSRMATIEDDSYPQTTDAASPADLHVRVRESGYRRHELLGLNAFLLQTFKQFADILGVRTVDYMSGSTTSIDQAIQNVVTQARTSTARVNVRTQLRGDRLEADVEVGNLTGHRFPSGVAFRRAFLDLVVDDSAAGAQAPPIFESGRSDERGRLLGINGRPLPSESFERDRSGRQQYQEHFDVEHPVTSADQVEIFEELTTDHDGNITTSFLRRHHEIKDNRILPIGWSRAGRVPMPRHFLEATYPKGRAASDPAYLDGAGHALVRYLVPLPPNADRAKLRVTATLYYQSWAPYYLAQRTEEPGEAAQRLRALVEHLDLSGSQLAGWKLRVASATTQVR